MATLSFGTFISKDSKFVLKLRVAREGGAPQIRRVLLHRVLNERDEVSYDKLEKLAIGYAYPNIDIIDTKDFDVMLTYYDVDNDCVVIASDEELMDAVHQFSSLPNPVLRITTDVKCLKNENNEESGLKHTLELFAEMEKEKEAENEKKDDVTKAMSISNLVKSVISTLATSVAVTQAKETSNDAAAKPGYFSEAAASALANLTPRQAVELNETAEKLVREVVGNIGMSEETAEPSAQRSPVATAPAKSETQTETGGETKPAAKVDRVVTRNDMSTNAPEPVPFIHGRHTCDACLTTPIVGLRYHATNLPDYDLCEKCRDNYKGSEIQFETVELDRDRPFQERWQRKRARWAQRARRGPHGHRHHVNRHGPGHCHGPRNFRRRQHGPAGPGPSPPRAPDSMDEALKEAIRRSLQDVAVQPPAQPPAQAVVEVQPRPEQNIFATVAVTASAVESVSGETADATDVSSVQPELPIVDVTPNASASEEEAPQPSENESVGWEDDTKDGSVASEDDIKVAPVGQVLATPKRSPSPPTNPSPAVSQFSEDAEGNGSVARVLGQTLDQCATAIDAMLDEIRRDNVENADNASVDTDIKAEVVKTDSAVIPVETVDEDGDEDSSEDSCSSLVHGDGESFQESGSSIVDGEESDEEDADSRSRKSDEGWQVVSEDEQIAGDETLARAAQLVGSALFESDMRSSEAPMSNSLTSFPSSVPTVTSELSPVVLDRWAVQLSQLRELGFMDEVKCVEILERLNAANIGVGSDDEVTVAQVVNELLKN